MPTLYGFAGEIVCLAGSMVLTATINLLILPLRLVPAPILKDEKPAAALGHDAYRHGEERAP